jgi:hypothetical protein
MVSGGAELSDCASAPGCVQPNSPRPGVSVDGGCPSWCFSACRRRPAPTTRVTTSRAWMGISAASPRRRRHQLEERLLPRPHPAAEVVAASLCRMAVALPQEAARRREVGRRKDSKPSARGPQGSSCQVVEAHIGCALLPHRLRLTATSAAPSRPPRGPGGSPGARRRVRG